MGFLQRAAGGALRRLGSSYASETLPFSTGAVPRLSPQRSMVSLHQGRQRQKEAVVPR